MRLRFTKVDAAGNDYLVVNTADSTYRDWPAVARMLCDRQHGAGADGLVVISHLGRSRFRIECVNPDGSPSPADGNAMRGCARAVHSRYGYRTVTLLSGTGAYEAVVDGPTVSVTFPPGGPVRGPLQAGGRSVHAVQVGTEHAVVMVAGAAELDRLDVAAVGGRIRRDRVFAPRGANVNLVAVLGDGRLQARSYDRGMDRETLSSGSGAIAAALVARATGATSSADATVQTAGGDVLEVRPAEGRGTSVSGAAVEVFDGETRWEPKAADPAGPPGPRAEHPAGPPGPAAEHPVRAVRAARRRP